MKQKWKKTQYVELSIDEIFCFMDKLDAVKDNLEEVWDVVDDFLMECESQFEISPGFLKSLEELDLDKDFVEVDLDNLDDFLDDLFGEDIDDDVWNDYEVLKAYQEYKKKLLK